MKRKRRYEPFNQSKHYDTLSTNELMNLITFWEDNMLRHSNESRNRTARNQLAIIRAKIAERIGKTTK